MSLSIQINYTDKNGGFMTAFGKAETCLDTAADLARKGFVVGSVTACVYPSGKGRAKRVAMWTCPTGDYYGTPWY